MSDIERTETGHFQPGTSGNPAGKPKGLVSGRSKALGALDRIVGRDENIEILEAALEGALRKRPLWFFVNIVMPLLPKESKGVLDNGDRVIEWRGLLSVCGATDGQRTEVGGG
ncbi:MAG: DUF5681 domain-containing protein [Kiritimatiellae bacterium]|nr:DUF5681 domain-containing protein [Kiritimatiellia bacterium]